MKKLPNHSASQKKQQISSGLFFELWNSIQSE